MRTFLRFIVAIHVICFSSLASATNLPNRNFWVGYNEAWFGDDNYLNWLSSNPVFGAPSHFGNTLNVLAAYFDGMKDGNAKIVRIWLFPGLQGISLTPYNPPAPQTQGLTPEFLQNLEVVLRIARSNGLKVYITLLNGNDMSKAVQDANQPLITYFQNLLMNHNGELTAFKTGVLLPLLDRLNHYRDAIYGIDLMNEIEAPVSVGYFPSLADAQNWIRDMASFVKANSSFPVTSSAGFGYAVQEISEGLFSGLGLDFYDVHIYADLGRYAGQDLLCETIKQDGHPIILGEYGQSTKLFDDRLQNLTTASFLFSAKYSCFSSALAWKFETTANNWWTYLLRINPDRTLTFRPAYYIIKWFGVFQSAR